MILTALMLLTVAQAQPVAKAPAAATPKAPAPTATATPVTRADRVRLALQKAGISPAGITRMTENRPQVAAQLQAAAQSINQINQQLRQAELADPADLNLIGSLLKKRDDVVAGVARVRTAETITLLQDLSAPDRKILLRIQTQSRNASAPPASPQPK